MSYFDIVEFTFLHSLEVWYLRIHSCYIVLYRVFSQPANVLANLDTETNALVAMLTSGDDIFTLRTFSSIMRSSSQADSMKRVWESKRD